MARRKRRRNLPLLGTAPGQKGRLVIKPSELVVERQPDKVILHDRGGGRQTHTIPGKEHHIHLGGRPRPERPVFDFDVMSKEIAERVQERLKQFPINLGGLDKSQFEFKSRWRGKDGIIRGVLDVRKVVDNKWLVLHPLKLLGKMFTRKLGRPAFRKGTMEYKKALELRKKYAPSVQEIYGELLNESQAALNRLKMLANANKVTWENRNFYMKEFEKAVKKAENRFTIRRKALMDAYILDLGRKLKEVA